MFELSVMEEEDVLALWNCLHECTSLGGPNKTMRYHEPEIYAFALCAEEMHCDNDMQ